jgi:5-methylcytosine-specific restriction endonuclease McrA
MDEKRSYSRYTDVEIAEVISESRSLTEAAELLGINRKTVQRVAWTNDVEPLGERRPNHDRVLNKVRNQRTPHIMRYVKRHNLIPYFCAECRNDGVWQSKDLVLELDHIDGDCLNNRLENLRWLCPNCHSQTPTYKNRKRESE